MEKRNLKGRKYSMGNGFCFYNVPENTKFLVMEVASREVISTWDNRSDACSAMISESLNKDRTHCLIAEEPGNDTLIVLERF